MIARRFEPAAVFTPAQVEQWQAAHAGASTQAHIDVVASRPASSVASRPRILYLISATPSLAERAFSLNATWTRHVREPSRVMWFTDHELPCLSQSAMVVRPRTEVRRRAAAVNLTRSGHARAVKDFAKFRHAQLFYLRQFDWFVGVDDDTFVLPPNMEALLAQRNPDVAHYLGRTMWVQHSGAWCLWVVAVVRTLPLKL